MDGSSPTRICDIPLERRSLAGAWVKHDRIYLAQWRGGLLEVPANGGTIRERMKAPDDLVDYHSLSVLPDGETLLASAHLVGESSRVDVIRDGKILRSFMPPDGGATSASYAPSGYLVFEKKGRGIWAAPFSLDKLDTTGEAFVIDPDGSAPSVARDGSLVYARNVARTPGRLVWIDRSGHVIGTIGEAGEGLADPLLSPSGSLVAFTLEEKGNPNVWTLDLASGATRRVTRSTGVERACSWSADGGQILVARMMPGNWSSPDNGLYLVQLGGEGEPTRVADGVWGQLLPGGDGVLYWKFGLRNDDRLEWKPLAGAAQPRPFVASMKRARYPVLSPDGHLVAFESDDSGTDEIWVARFTDGDETAQLSRGGGNHPVWSRDGRSLFYEHDGSLYSVSVSGVTRADYGTPKLLFDGKPENLAVSRGFDVLPGGSGFITVHRLPLQDAAIVYVQNWAAEFPRRP